MKTPPLSFLGILVGLAFLAGCSKSEEKPLNRDPGKKVIVLSIDTLRADMLNCYGGNSHVMPTLDALAATGMVFRNAIAPMGTTFPSHSSMFTGLYPRVHGVRWNGDSLSDEHTTLAEILSANGWITGAFVSYKAMLSKGGLDQGFQRLSDPRSARGAKGIRSGREVNDLALGFLDEVLEKSPEKDVFLWLHYFEAHSPYPLTDYAKKSFGDYQGPMDDGAEVSEMIDLNRSANPSAEDFAAFRALYEGRVLEADKLVKDLVDGLKERGVFEETIIVVVGDHGQLLGEHQMVGHGPLLWQKVLDVPFIVINPYSPHAGEEITRVGVIDLTPTVLEMLGFEPVEGMQGRSLLPALQAKPLANMVYYSEVRIANPRQTRPGAQRDAVAVFSGRFKFVLDGKKEFLWNILEDQEETHPLSKRQYLAEIERLRPLAVRHKELEPSAISVQTELSPEMLLELQELGYVDGE